MNITAIFFIGIPVLLFIAALLSWVLKSRKAIREAKNYERGLKMVPMLIHLPPTSDDTEIGSRDERDVVEETISKAQVLYDIIASTAQKSFKNKLYGERHIAFEIVAAKGVVNFYVAVPVALTSVVQQAIVSAYPTASLEEVTEHNIFSPVGKISGTIGGELNLKEAYYNPIATYQESKRDSMQSLLNALANLSNEDGAGIQIMIRPANPDWSKKGIKIAKDRKKGKDKSAGTNAALRFTRDIFTALAKPPEEKESKDGSQLTNLEQSGIDAIENKTKYAAYETLIRVIASSNTAQKSQQVLNNLVATFALFDAPGKNGFKYSEARDIESFVTAYIMRFFPPEIKGNILNSVELATIFHFPDQSRTPTSQLERQASKQVDGPRNMPEDGLLLGYNIFRGIKKEVRLSDDDRRRHMYIVGQTGTGKSTILENLALQDMLAGKGFAFVDPHGDAIESLISMVPAERTEDIVYFNPADMDYPLGLNLFEHSAPEQKDFLIQEAINMLYKLYDPQHQGIIGPRYEHWFRNAALTLMADPGGSTFVDIPKVFTDNEYAKQKLKHVTDQTVLDFWNKEMAQTSDYHKSEVLGWFVSKFGAFLSNEMMRNVIGQTKSAFDLREIMDEGKILFVNLSKGKTGELNSKLLGMIFIMQFQAAAMSRANIDEQSRKDFTLYVDEFQNFSTDSFSTILSEARKYRLNLIVANQFIGQLTDEIRDAVFGNVGSIVSFRTGATDADFLVKQFQPVFDNDDLVKVPNYQTITRLMISGVPSQPFSMATLPPLGHANPELGSALKRLSAAKYGRPRKVVEAEIFKRLATTPAPAAKPAFGAGARRPITGGMPAQPSATVQPRPAGATQVPPKPGQQPSFLDEWLAKRKATQATKATPAPAAKPVAPVQPAQNPQVQANQGVKIASVPASAPPLPPQAPPQSPVSEASPVITEPTKPADPKPTLQQPIEQPAETFGENDELYIDKDGNVHYRQED